MLDDLGATVAGALDDGIESIFGYQFSNRNTGYGGIAGQRDHGVAVSAEDKGGYVFYTDVEFQRDEGAEASGIEDAGHADDALAGKAAHLVGGLRVGDDDEDAVRRMLHDLADYIVHDFVVGIQ